MHLKTSYLSLLPIIGSLAIGLTNKAVADEIVQMPPYIVDESYLPTFSTLTDPGSGSPDYTGSSGSTSTSGGNGSGGSSAGSSSGNGTSGLPCISATATTTLSDGMKYTIKIAPTSGGMYIQEVQVNVIFADGSNMTFSGTEAVNISANSGTTTLTDINTFDLSSFSWDGAPTVSYSESVSGAFVQGASVPGTFNSAGDGITQNVPVLNADGVTIGTADGITIADGGFQGLIGQDTSAMNLTSGNNLVTRSFSQDAGDSVANPFIYSIGAGC
jgi:hypothetical protein